MVCWNKRLSKIQHVIAFVGEFIYRLNSGIRNRHNFFLRPIYIFQKVLSDSVNHADSEDVKVFVRFSENTILKFFTNFWKCVGGADTRGCFILKITQCVDLITLVILIYKLAVVIWFRPNPRNFNPRRPPQRYWYQKMCNFIAHLLSNVRSLPEDVNLPKRLRKSLKIDFRFSNPRKLIRVWHRF